MTADSAPTLVDVAIIGGGIAALWTLDALDEAGYSVVLIEPGALGQGQTLASQGIIHGGLKYTLRGLLTGAANAISEMPERWQASLEGRRRPDLRAVRVASPCTWLWRTASVRSTLSLTGARVALRTKPVAVAQAERPPLLWSSRGVHRVDEPVLDTVSLVDAFVAQHGERMLAASPLPLTAGSHGWMVASHAGPLIARVVVLAAGGHNAALRQSLDLPSRMQRRPLHMALVRGALPEFFGHCVDGAATRVTITTHRSSRGPVWQLGGQLAEEGVGLEEAALLNRARSELGEVLPEWDPHGFEWATYRVDRAELDCAGLRPDDAQCVVDRGTLVTLWPTKLALAPRAAALALEAVRATGLTPAGGSSTPGPRPTRGSPPWENASWRRWP